MHHSSASQDDGVLLLAWNGTIPAEEEAVTIATVDFTFQGDHKAADVDSGTFRLQPMERLGRSLDDTFGVEAVLAEASGGEPNFYYYMNTTPGFFECGVDFAYAGSQENAAGSAVTFRCENLLGTPLSGLLEVGGKTYFDPDGNVKATLAPGEYRYRVRSSGYGAHMDTLTVTNEAQTIELAFRDNASILAAAAETLEIGYQTGASARHCRPSATIRSKPPWALPRSFPTV